MARNELRSPIKWFGGKGNMVSKLLPLFPTHKSYVEVFGGGGSMLFAKSPSAKEVYNDIDEGLVNMFTVIKEPDTFNRLFHLLNWTPYARSEYFDCYETMNDDDLVIKAYKWMVVSRQSFSGYQGKWSSVVSLVRSEMAATCNQWQSILRMLPDISSRLSDVTIICKTWKDVLNEYKDKDTLVYLDPPYIHSTRRDGEYRFEMSNEDHEDMVDYLLSYSGMVLLSGYVHPIYERLESNGWVRTDIETVCSAVGRTRDTGILGEGTGRATQMRIESVWRNPLCIKKCLNKGGLNFEEYQ